MTTKHLESLIDEDKRIEVVRVDIEIFESLAESLGIHSVPTLIRFQNEVEMKRITGIQNTESLVDFVR